MRYVALSVFESGLALAGFSKLLREAPRRQSTSRERLAPTERGDGGRT